MSQRKEVLMYLQTHKKGISQLEATNKFGATRLSAIIYDLRHKYGYNIKAVDVKTKNRYGHTTMYSRYVLVG